MQRTAAVPEPGEVKNFVHTIKIRPEITPFQQKLRRLLFSVRLRSQNVGESIMHYVAALRELPSRCEFGAMADEMIRDQLVEKTNSNRIRECLLLENELTLQKAITLASHIQSVLADEQAMVKEDDTVVGAVQRTTFRGGGRHQPAQFQHKEFRSAPKQSESSYPSAGKKCYRCGSSSHVANSSTCPAKSATCNKCNKN